MLVIFGELTRYCDGLSVLIWRIFKRAPPSIAGIEPPLP